MSGYRPIYLETSAVVKLVRQEAQSEALGRWLKGRPDRLTSALTAIEVSRMLRRARAKTAIMTRARDVLESLVVLRIDDRTLEQAAAMKDPLLRALDAIHLGAALSIGDYPEAFVTYDERLVAAAGRMKIRVVSPS